MNTTRHHAPRRARLLLSICTLTLAAGGLSARQGGVLEPPAQLPLPVPFEILDSIEGTNVDLVYSSMNGLVVHPTEPRFYVVNPYHGKILRFDGLSGPPSLSIDSPNGVMGLAYWVSPVDQHEELIAISRGNYGVSFHDPDSGDLTEYIALPAEPADLLIEGNLFVSCAADSLVLEIDLVTRQVVHTYDLTGAIAYSRMFAHGGLVYITAQHSGNNSLVLRGPGISAGGQPTLFNGLTEEIPILDVGDPAASSTGLPDEDVMCLNPATKTVDVALKNAGTTLAAGGVHPTTGEAWILNMEANNKDPNAQSEPLVKGNFVFNRITVSPLGGNGTAPVVAQAADFVSLDDLAAGGAPGEAVGHPYDLYFHGDGTVFVIGLLTDNLVQLDASGAVLQRWDVGEGSVPRDVHVLEALDTALVYCWNTNEVAVIDLSPSPAPTTRLDLGYDPTSPLRKLGREIFFDGHNSEKGNASCASCHIEGGSDFVAWNISNMPFDNKGPLQTQNLRNIAPLNPYHWRGERAELVDFNVAFDALLGGERLDSDDFAAFQAYVFGMKEPANPRTHLERHVDSLDANSLYNFNVKGDVLHEDLSAANGQFVYFTKPNVGVSTCQDCHTLPTGTANEFFHDGIINQDHRSSFDVPAYNGMWRKEQKSRVTIDLVGNPEVRPPLGLGTAHSGFLSGVYEFVTEQFPPLTVEERQDVALFLHQIDSGVGPAVHRAALLDQDHGSSEGFIRLLMDQARAGNCDLGCFGTVTLGGQQRRLRWWFDPVTSRFLPEDSGESDRRFGFFRNQAEAGNASNLFVGLPRGMGARWMIDYDDDGLRNLDEADHGTSEYVADHDGDGFHDGPEVAQGSEPDDDTDTPNDTTPPQATRIERIYHTARVAKFIVETDEYCTLSATYDSNGAPASEVVTLDDVGRHFTVLFRDLDPSYSTINDFTSIDPEFTLTDQAGNTTVVTASGFVTEEFILATEQTAADLIIESTIQDLQFLDKEATPEGYRLRYTALLHHQKNRLQPELASHALIARVLVKEPGDPDFRFAAEEDLTLDGFPDAPGTHPSLIGFFNTTGGLPAPAPFFLYLAVGPFVASAPSNAAGETVLNFLIDAPLGSRVMVSVESVVEVLDTANWPASGTANDRAFHLGASNQAALVTRPVLLD